MEAHFDVGMLLAAWLMSVYALYLQVLVVRRVRQHDRQTGMAWAMGGAIVIGTGLWAEALLGVLALQLPLDVGYVKAVVLASWLPAVGLSAGTIWMQSFRHLSTSVKTLGSLVVTGGMTLLTFINASAIVLQPQVSWDVRHVAAAVLIMLVACGVGSVLIRRILLEPLRHVRALGVSALVAALFRAGQTLILMGMILPSAAICLSADQLSPDALHVMLSAPVLVLLGVVHVGTILDERAMRRQEALQASLQQAQAALEEAAQHDAVTGMPNRIGFEKGLRVLLEGDADHVGSLAVLRLSLDGFKAVADSYGPDIGDAIVRHIGGRLKGQVREGDLLARVDADEYMLLCNGQSGEHEMAQLAQRLSEVVHEPCLIRDHDITLSCSIGIAAFPGSNNADQLLNHSRDAMLTARKAGGGVYCFYERGMDRSGMEQVEMQRDLRHAIERQELSLHFQPKLRAHDHSLAGVEALLRWRHPVRGDVSPARFIPVAERFGLIGELGLWVLNEACRHIRLWHEAGLNVPVAINLSAHQLRQPDLELRVRDALKRHRVPARMLIMEITESTAMEDIDASLRVFDMLDAIGVRLSIDDFGTGYSSLSYLRRLPARQLKIDRSFVKDLASSLDAQAIVEAVVRLSHALGLKVVAEGVETQDQADILARLQCDELQGFLFAKPMPESALLAWLVQRGTHVPQARPAADGADADLDEEDRRSWSELEAAGS
jgi:diguanylate cyclase (GGDEF)-like protein